MGFQERSYSGKIFRPRPEIHYSNAEHLLIVATPWGPRSSAEKAIKTIANYYLATNEDMEITSPFERLSCLSTTANNLRIAVLLANDWLSREENKSEYVSGVEIFATVVRHRECVWVQVGHPQVLLYRPGRHISSLGTSLDLAFDLSNEAKLLAPLPQQLLGLDSTVNLTMNSFRPTNEDRLILISRSSLPSTIYDLKASQIDLDPISRLLAQDDPDLPFWLGIMGLNR